MATPQALRKALKTEFTSLFNGVHSISIFEQELPQRKYESDEKTLFPFILIEVEKGKFAQAYSDEKNTCTINIVIGVNQEISTQPEALEILNKIALFLIENPVIANKYKLVSNESLEWSVGKDSSAPYEYGVIEGINFELPKINQIQSEYN